jgi:hypothetical protein
MYDKGNSGVPEGENARERKMMAKFRCGNEERKQVLDGRRGRRCRMCYEESTCGMDGAR